MDISRWTDELKLSISAALSAGERFRREFCRDGGPRGPRGHATIDDEVEADLRALLTGSFPGYGYLGEETGRLSPEEDSPIWVIDPNDGTTAFQEGYRGASVSIALVYQGVPVLGVVYAYNAPTDDGDCLAWAEGLTVNRWSPGREAQPALTASDALPNGAPGLDLPVLVSHKADTRPEANARMCAPRRFRCVVGIAYRLALTAAGEGAAATTLTAPRAWDMAGGHALLRGAGLELYTAEGTPVRYDREGNCTPSRAFFGGDPAVVQGLRDSDWDGVAAGSADGMKPASLSTGISLSLVEPQRPLQCIPAAILDRAQGALLGACAGDSLGSLVEFLSADEIAREYPQTSSGGPEKLADGGTWGTIAGQPTDDTEMALLMARAIVSRGSFSLEDIAAVYRWWLDSEPFDMGNTIYGALNGSSNGKSQANGALMRAAPLGIYVAGRRWAAPGMEDLRRELEKLVRQEAALTHVHPVCAAVNVLYVDALAIAICEGGTPHEIYERVVMRAAAGDIPTEVREWTVAAGTGFPEEYRAQQGWVRIAWQNALWQLLNAADPAGAIRDTVRRGGDTDTNGAIAGALLGALYGAAAFPQQWRDAVFSARAQEVSGVRRPRPAVLWPVDWQVLSERLFLTGAGAGTATLTP